MAPSSTGAQPPIGAAINSSSSPTQTVAPPTAPSSLGSPADVRRLGRRSGVACSSSGKLEPATSGLRSDEVLVCIDVVLLIPAKEVVLEPPSGYFAGVAGVPPVLVRLNIGGGVTLPCKLMAEGRGETKWDTLRASAPWM
mmetsp:Transcript_89493/g.239914  ORF Transcript_89493/g.239914 Transcript_89493/m.239914 type:complete len:140 (-) Transcript_89493:325-744(-)